MTLPPVYGILDGDVLARRGLAPVEAAEALLEGNVRLLQFRWKGSYNRDVFAQASAVSELCRQAGAIFVINDRADVALLLDAGIHVGQDDLAPADVRTVVGNAATLGVSTHNEGQFRQAAAEAPDYIALGPIFGTTSKHRPDPIVGTRELARLRPLFSGPVVAIGGITRETAAEVWRAGADSIAVIGDLYPSESTKASVRARAEEWMRIAQACATPAT